MPVKNDKVENHYPTMTTEEIAGLKIPAAANSVLYLWATAPKLPDAIFVMQSWGFAYKTCLCWDKGRIGYGYWFMGQHELLLVGVRGKFSPPPKALRVPSVYRQLKGRHSEKPEQIKRWLTEWFPTANRLELFARRKTEGWHHWGNEIPSDIEL